MARPCIELNKENGSLEEIEQLMKSTGTQEGFLRLQAISYLYRGYDRKEFSKQLKRSDKTLTNWIKRFNSEGISGLLDKARSGRPRNMERDYFELEATSYLSDTTATLVKFHGYLTCELNVELSYSTCWRYTKESGYSLQTPRRLNSQSSPELQEQFIKELNELIEKEIPIFFCDEVGIEGDPRPCKSWFLKGTKLRVKNDELHVRQSVIGAVNHASGEFFSLVVPYTNTEVFQTFLDEFSLDFNTLENPVYLVLDNASWHHTKKLNWYGILPIYLPPYSPELNPIERLWKVLKDRYFRNWYSRDEDVLTDRICEGLLSFYKNQDEVASICAWNF